MGERDAFGREIGEDPLAQLGWETTRTPDPTPAPAPAASPEPQFSAPQQQFSAPPLPRYQGRRRRRGLGLFVLILMLSIVTAVAGGIFSLVQVTGDAVDGLEGAIRDAVPTAVAPTPAGTESGSLLRAKDLKAALAKLPPGEIRLIRVAPDRIDAQVTSGGKTQLVQVTAHGGVSTVTTPTSIPGDPVKVNSAAPARIVRTASRRSRRDPSSVNYLVLSRFGDKAEWQLFFDDGLHYSASANGKKVRRVG
jgi:hypothetical protein